MQINVVDSGYPRGLHCMTHSQLFYKGFKRLRLVLLLFDIVLCLIQVKVRFLIFKNWKPKIFQNFFMIIVTTSSYHFDFMYEMDTLFEHMQSYRTGNNKTNKKNGVVPNINSSKKYMTRLTCHGII